MPEFQRSQFDGAQSFPWGRPETTSASSDPQKSTRSTFTHPVPDDLSEASVRLEVTLEGNSLPDDDRRQGLDGNSQVSFKTDREDDGNVSIANLSK